jgi:hypothetical protein
MSTTNPRLTITLQPSVSAQIRELSRLTKNSQSAVISELLESSSPVFERLIQVLTAAETAKAELSGQVHRDLQAAQVRIERQMGLVMADFGDVTKPLLDKVEKISRRTRRATPGPGEAGAARGPRGARRVSPTPLSNRGVRYDHNIEKSVAPTPSHTNAKPKKSGVKVGGVGK